MFALTILCLAVPIACLQVKVPLSDIECQYTKTDITTGEVIDKSSNTGHAECIAKCFYSSECSHISHDDALKECRLFKESSIKIEPGSGQIFENIHCEAPTKSGSEMHKRDAMDEVRAPFPQDNGCPKIPGFFSLLMKQTSIAVIQHPRMSEHYGQLADAQRQPTRWEQKR